MSNRVVKLDTKAARELLTTEREREGVAWEPIDISSLPDDVKNLLNEDSEREKLYQAVAKLVEPHVTVPPGKEISVNYIPARLQYGFVNPKKKKVIKQALRLA